MGLVILITMVLVWGAQKVVKDAVYGKAFGVPWRFASAICGAFLGALVYPLVMGAVLPDAPFTDATFTFWFSSVAISAYMGWAALPAQ